MENRMDLIFALLFRSESPALFATEKYRSHFMPHRMLQKINRPYLNFPANKAYFATKSETFCAIKKKDMNGKTTTIDSSRKMGIHN
tara:strand:+ start:579 stop:836 length:258 start_codon:yes stop_codon:yes gene_type:complete